MIFLYISRNCSLAFRVAEEELGVTALLEVEDVVRAGRPDELSVMTYLAQLYHRLEGEGEGEPSPVVRRTRRRTGGRRKGAIQSLMSSQCGRPVSWHGGDTRVAVTPVERENPFTDSVEELGLTNNNNQPPVVQLRKVKRPKYSNYNNSHHSHRQAKENSVSPASSSSSSSSAARRRRPASYIGTEWNTFGAFLAFRCVFIAYVQL